MASRRGQPVVQRAPTTSAARAASRDPIVTDAPAAARRRPSPRPSGPVPPRIPTSIGTHWHNGPGPRFSPTGVAGTRRSGGAARVGSPAVSPSNGLLSGKRILVTGVLTDASLAFGVARRAQAEGAELVLSGAGRGLSLTRRTARKLDAPVDVIEIDVTDPAHLRAAADDLDGAVGPGRRHPPRHRLRPPGMPGRRHPARRVGARWPSPSRSRRTR